MNPDQEIFQAAVALSAANRLSYLDTACAGQPERRDRIEALLRSHDVSGFMEHHADGASAPGLEQSDERIEHYKLLEQIGEGGFGVVWVAEQLEPVRRRVAVKIIKPGMDSREVIARFGQERQALAMMDHPNIAKVFDAGATNKGRPYFVMELVRGVRITEYCDEANLSTAERLRLFIAVCQAVQHAHQKGIIHRDLKPSNILVALNDVGAPTPKIIDFGVAKAMQPDLTDETVYTQFEQIIGTPAYMSPEQAGLGGLDIDTRSDVYSLGVLLYELLTGRPPFDPRELLSAGLDEMRRVIREVEPPKPSTRRTQLKLAIQKSGKAKSALRIPHSAVAQDLDWIVMKAIEKDRNRRYDTANGLALDIQRFLTDEPVSATPPGAGYRFRKFARRNRAPLRVAAGIATLLVGATIVSSWQAMRATAAEKLATAERDQKDQARKDAEEISTFLGDVFQSPDPARKGRDIKVAELLDKAAEKLDTDLVNQPERRAKLQGALGRGYHGLGIYDMAIPLQESARDYFVRERGKAHDETLNAMRDMADSCFALGKYSLALELREEVTELRMKTSGPTHRETLRSKLALAASYQTDFRLPIALRLREEVLDVCRREFGPADTDTLRATHALAHAYHSAYRAPEAIALQREALKLSIAINTREHPDTLAMMRTLAKLLHDYADPAEARTLRKDELAVRLKVNGPAHSDTLLCRSYLAESIYKVDRNITESIAMLNELVKDYTKALGPEHRDTLFAVAKLAEFYISSGRPEEAITWVESLAASPPGGAMLMLKLATLQAWLHMDAGYTVTCQRALQDAANSNAPPVAERAAKSYCLRPSSDPDLLKAAVTLARRAADIGGKDAYCAAYQMCLGMAEYRIGDYRAADRALIAAEQGSERSGADRPLIRDPARFFRAMSLFRQGANAEARKLFAETRAEMRPLPVDGQPLRERADHDDLIVWLAFKEADALINSKNEP